MKTLKKIGLISILTAALLAGPIPGIKAKHDSKPLEVSLSIPSAQSAETSTISQETKDIDNKDIEHIIMYCLVKGEQHEAMPMKYLELRSKTGKGERKLYFEVYYSVKNDNVSASKIRFVESEYEIQKGGTDIPHNYMNDSVFTQHKDKDRYIIKQKMISDGGEYGILDGVDTMQKRTVTETIDRTVINADDLEVIEDKDEIKRVYKNYVKEILEIVGEEEIEEEIPKATYEVSM